MKTIEERAKELMELIESARSVVGENVPLQVDYLETQLMEKTYEEVCESSPGPGSHPDLPTA
jgi:hypothetical protein